MSDVFQDDKIFVGKSGKPEYLTLRLANRHGLVTGATGTGKTVTLQGLAESFARAGVPVFAADVKGDLSGIAAPGAGGEKIIARPSRWASSGRPRPRRPPSGTSSARPARPCAPRSARWVR